MAGDFNVSPLIERPSGQNTAKEREDLSDATTNVTYWHLFHQQEQNMHWSLVPTKLLPQ
jgi:hypothetical protein